MNPDTAGAPPPARELLASARPPARPQRPWERPGLHADEMHHHSGDTGVTARTPWMNRRMVRFLLTGWGAPESLTTDAELVVSELTTNAVRFGSARPPKQDHVPAITLGVWYAPGLAVIEVSDDNGKPPEIRAAGPESETGRGLQLVQHLSREWSWYHPRPGRKTVYAVLGPSALPDCPVADLRQDVPAAPVAPPDAGAVARLR
jgi:anti-sigma regulatory factor (Ser/Thr protein kinase)